MRRAPPRFVQCQRPPVSLEAYEAYLRTRYFRSKGTEQELNKALALFGQAIESDPNDARAYAGLAESFVTLADYGFLPPRQSFPKAKAAATKALVLNQSLAQAHVAMGCVRLHYDWNCQSAEQNLRRAIELNPGYASAYEVLLT